MPQRRSNFKHHAAWRIERSACGKPHYPVLGYSIRNAAREILRINKRRKAGGTYATSEELKEIRALALIEAK
jgi:hypothetical protein